MLHIFELIRKLRGVLALFIFEILILYSSSITPLWNSANDTIRLLLVVVIGASLLVINQRVLLVSRKISYTKNLFILQTRIRITSRFRLFMRKIWNDLWRALLREQLMSKGEPAHPLLSSIQKLYGLVSGRLSTLFLLLLVAASVAGIPYWQYTVRLAWAQYEAKNPETVAGLLQNILTNEVPTVANVNFLDLALLGAFTTILALSMWGAFLYYLNRPKHIVMQFSISDDLDAKHLRPLASTLTHAFVAELRQIGILLNLRQTENVATRLENPLSLFVTSGQDDELVRQLGSLSDFEASNIRVPLGGLASLLIFNLARTRVRGYIQKGKDGNLDVWVEVYRRGRRGTLEISKGDLRIGATGFVDERRLRELARALAVTMTFELGQVGQIALTDDSLELFLTGLYAVSRRNWWYAANAFRRVTAYEEPRRISGFGIGHYHIGTALLSQGNPELALPHLLQAAHNIVPNAETFYALTLAYLALHTENLIDKNYDPNAPMSSRLEQRTQISAYDQTVAWLQKALELRPDFPEARHLLGSVHYQRAKLLERRAVEIEATELVSKRRKIKIRKIIRESKTFYILSSRELRIAIHLLNSVLAHTSFDLSEQRARLFAEKMVVTHHLADTLRATRLPVCMEEALHLYDEATFGQPDYLKNYIDRAQTLCIKGKFKEAYQFLRDNVFSNPIFRLNADVNLYRGWSAVGLALECLEHKDIKIASNFIREAMRRIDFALSMRPRFVSPRPQTDWQTPFMKAIKQYNNQIISVASVTPSTTIQISDASFYEGEINLNAMASKDTWMLETFLNWRRIILTNILLKVPAPSSMAAFELSHSSKLATAFEKLSPIRREFCIMLFEFDSKNTMNSSFTIRARIKLAEKMSSSWSEMRDEFHILLNSIQARHRSEPKHFEFRERLIYDLYAEYTILYCRLLAEVRDYETLRSVATRFDEDFLSGNPNWYSLWNEAVQPNAVPEQDIGIDNPAGFSRAYSRFRHMAIISWKFLADMELEQADLNLSELQKRLAQSLNENHPLFLFVRARYYLKHSQYQQATDDYKMLLRLVDQFDPRADEQFGGIPDITQDRDLFSLNQTPIPKYEAAFDALSSRQKLYYMERVCGQQQFEFFLDKANILIRLADLHSRQNDYDTAVQYILDALTWSPYTDFDIRNLKMLVHYLYKLDRFTEAISVVQEALNRWQQRSPNIDYNDATHFEFQVMECILLTRLSDYDQSMKKGLRLLQVSLYRLKNLQKPINEQQQEKNELQPRLMKELNELKNELGKVSLESSSLNWHGRKLLAIFKTIVTGCNIHWASDIPLPETFQQEFLAVLASPMNSQGTNPSGENTTENHPFDGKAVSKQTSDREGRNQAYQLITLTCDLYNNLAYNLAKLGIALDEALALVVSALACTITLRDAIDNPTNNHPRLASKLATLNEKVAQYYDTQAWVYYRKRNSINSSRKQHEKDLGDAMTALYEQSMRQDTGLSIPHYHLARVFVAMFQDKWQGIERDDETVTRHSGELTTLLRRASHHWIIANQLDENDRLQTELRELRDIIDTYLEFFEKTHMQMPKLHSKDEQILTDMKRKYTEPD